MVAALREDREDLVRAESLDLDLVRVAGIYGPNAAGKSNVISALQFMQQAVRKSHRDWKPDGPIPQKPFLLDSEHRSQPSLFEADFLLKGVRYKYGFCLDAKEILEEWLFAYPNGRRQTWFNRDSKTSQIFSFGKQLKGSNRAIEGLTRKNSLFLSVAAENNHQTLLEIYRWFSGLDFIIGTERLEDAGVTETLLEEEANRSIILNFLRLADLGISGLSFWREPLFAGPTTQHNPLVQKFSLMHQTGSGPASLPLDEESRGTRVWLHLAGPILYTLALGSILCIDELDASLHPYLALEVIRIFQDVKSNPNNAQLIFNTHDTTLLGNLLGGPVLHRDQIWFVEKDNEGSTHLYPLTDFKPRKFENLERGYLQGRYGAISFIKPVPVAEDV